LHGEHFHGAIAFISEREHFTWRRGASRRGDALVSFTCSPGEEDVKVSAIIRLLSIY
jgi:hypothetical protein